jgi:hypothetical protein
MNTEKLKIIQEALISFVGSRRLFIFIEVEPAVEKQIWEGLKALEILDYQVINNPSASDKNFFWGVIQEKPTIILDFCGFSAYGIDLKTPKTIILTF